jgi:hypothetical protein
MVGIIGSWSGVWIHMPRFSCVWVVIPLRRVIIVGVAIRIRAVMGLDIGAVLSIVSIDVGISMKLAQGSRGDDGGGDKCIFHFTL